MNKVSVLFSVDTEHSIGGAFRDPSLRPVGNDRRIFFQAGKKAYGIPLIMDIADRYGFGVSFFLETLNRHYFGESESREVCEYILRRGHDVQLHLHPNFLNFRTPEPHKRKYLDQMHSYPPEQQAELIADGRECLIRYGAPAPVAFRAGNFGADRHTLEALARNGFQIDSSYNRAFLGSACRLTNPDINDAEPMNGIWELPVTNFLEARPGKGKRFRPLDINGVGFAQLRHVLKQAAETGPSYITILLHSFSFIHPLDVQYRRMRPRIQVIRRFRKLCAFLDARRSLFRVVTFGELTAAELKTQGSRRRHTWPVCGPALSFQRDAEQILDRLPIQKKITFSER